MIEVYCDLCDKEKPCEKQSDMRLWKTDSWGQVASDGCLPLFLNTKEEE